MSQESSPINIPALAHLTRNNGARTRKLSHLIRVVSRYFGGAGSGSVILPVKRDERIRVYRIFFLRQLRYIGISMGFILRERGHRDKPEPPYPLRGDNSFPSELPDVILRITAQLRCSFGRYVFFTLQPHGVRHPRSVPRTANIASRSVDSAGDI